MSEQIHYQHTQRGETMLQILMGVAVVGAAVAVLSHPKGSFVGAVPLLLVLGAIGFLFSSLTVTVTGEEVRWQFGPGLWTHRIARADIVKAEPTRTKWWYGYGIRITRRGWLFNVSGLDAVAVTQKSGRVTLIGTDEPQRLAAALS